MSDTRATLPTGIITFLFTDIEGSTEMVQRLGTGYDDVLAQHNKIVREAVASSQGVTVSTEGDSFFAVFSTPADGVGAALAAQQDILAHQWPTGGRVLVRMGLHTGEGRLGGDNYVGVDVNRAARISAAGHGGQVLMSDTTKTLLEPSRLDVEYRDLGNHRLKDLDGVQRIFQVASAGLPSGFPPLRTAGAATNLPVQQSTFVGRESELEDVTRLLRENRLVTLTGVGGTGKTRLALQVAGTLIEEFPGGVYFVGLEKVEEPDRVESVVADTIAPTGDVDAVTAISSSAGSSPILLVLDNFEHVIEASPLTSQLLEACPTLRLLVTSQRLLRVQAEQVYPVPTLSLPLGASRDSVAASDSASLFVRRVRATDPTFVLTEDNAEDVAGIVSRLDGLPLAIELAAARVRLFGVPGLRTELESRFTALAGGYADAAERHQSLYKAIAWSYDLLEPDERALLRRASLFIGGFSLEAAAAFADGVDRSSVADALTSLLDKSLVTSTTAAGNIRFGMLESIRAYGHDRLAESDEFMEVGGSHAEYFLAMVREGKETFQGPETYALMERLATERSNLAAAIEWSAEYDPDLGLSLMLVLARYFEVVGALDEGRDLASSLLGASGPSPECRLIGLLGAASIEYWLLDYDRAASFYGEAIELAEMLNDRLRLAEALYGQAYTLIWLHRLEEAQAIGDQAYAVFKELEDPIGIRKVIAVQATLHWMAGNMFESAKLQAEFLELCRKQGDVAEELNAQLSLAALLLKFEMYQEAAATGIYSLERFVQSGDDGGTVMALDYLAIAVAKLDPSAGAKLGGAIEAITERRGGTFAMASLGIGDPRSIVDASLGLQAESLWAEGRTIDLAGAVDSARDWAQQERIEPAPVNVGLVLEAARQADAGRS